jgi:predicted DNA-binding transcriptional regulator AlpA
LLRDLNTLIVGATLDELRTLSAALAATQAHAMAHLLELVNERTQPNGHYMKAAEVAVLTGYSRSFLYSHGEQLGIAVRPDGVRGLRFPEGRVREWMEAHRRG